MRRRKAREIQAEGPDPPAWGEKERKSEEPKDPYHIFTLPEPRLLPEPKRYRNEKKRYRYEKQRLRNVTQMRGGLVTFPVLG